MMSRRASTPVTCLTASVGQVELGPDFKMPLNQADRQIVIKSWAQIEDKSKFGQTLFIQIFMYRPNLKRLFRLEAIPVDRLEEIFIFRKHAQNFTTFIDDIVRGMKDGKEAETVEHIRLKGGNHFQLTRGTNFDTEYWGLFVSSIVDQMELRSVPGKSREKLKNAWRVLFAFVVFEMKSAYLKEVEKAALKLKQFSENGSVEGSKHDPNGSD